MHDAHTTRDQLIAENAALRQRVAILETAEVQRQQVEETLQRTNDLLHSVSQLQSEFMVEADPRVSFDRLLHTLLTLTHSEYGFIGEIRHSATGDPYLKAYAITNIAWDRDSQAFYERYAPDGLEFHNMQTLFGGVMTTGEPVIANAPSTDPRRGGLPEGHPPLRAFLGLPVVREGTMIGMVGLANRPGGYDQALIAFLQPVLLTCGVMVDAYRQAQRRQQAEDTLRQSEQRYRHLIEHSLGLLCIHDLDGTLLEVNAAAARALGYQPQDGVGKNMRAFIAPAVQRQFDDYLARIRQSPTDRGLMRVMTRDGEERVWRYQNVRYEEPGHPPYVLGHAQDITDMLQTQQALQDSEARYRLLAEHVTDVIWVRDLQLRPTYISPSVTRLRGYSVEEAMSQTLLEALTPASREVAQQAFAHALTLERSGQAPPDRSRTLELEVTRKDGSTVWIETNVTFLRDAAGRPEGFLGVNRDISARKQAKQALQQAHDELEQRVADRTAALQRINASLEAEITERMQAETALWASEQRYRHLVDSSQGLICTHDLEGIVLSINPAAAQCLGAEPQALIGQTLRGVLAPSVQHQFESYLERIRCCGTARGLMRVVTHTGDERVLTYHNRLIEDAGTAPYVLGHAQDITERVHAEAALRASEELNRRIVEAVPGGIVQVSHAGIIVRANAEAQRILGLSDEDLTQRFGADFAPQTIWEDGSPCAVEDYPVTKCLATNQPQAATTIGVRRPDDTVAWAVFTAIPLTDPVTNQAMGAVVTFLDITERKHTEQERQRLEVQLHQMQKMDAIGTLAGGIAHEFNNMLAAILGFTQLANAKVPPTSPVSQYLQAVESAGQRAKDLVQQLLAFSHPSDHQQEPVPLAQVIQEALKLLRASLPTTLEIRQQIAPETGTVLADATQLQQVLMNLCANAEYAMRETGGILEVRVDNIEVKDTVVAFHPELQPGAYVRVRVQDTGVGIPADVLDRIFEPFFTTKGVGEGTGMGLAIVHGIVTRHGGVIRVESELGEGSTFTMYLPQIAYDTAHPADQPELIMPLGTGRILFVDDEEMLARLGEGLLERLGYEVVAHTHSLDALEAFQREPHRFDLVITDQTMPAMTGATLVEELRRIRSDIPIILCTGFSHLMNAEKAEALGVDGFVMKPGVTQELAVTIQEVLAKRAAQNI